MNIGKGSFGQVFLAKHINSQRHYALKAMAKRPLQYKYMSNELVSLRHTRDIPYTTRLQGAFQTSRWLYLVMDYCSQQDLSFHLANQGVLQHEHA